MSGQQQQQQWDLILQLATQTHAARIVEYHSKPCGPLPAGLCESVHEPGPHTNRRGPLLAHLHRVLWSPPAVARWLSTCTPLSRVVQRAYWVVPGQSCPTLAEAVASAARARPAQCSGGSASCRVFCYPRAEEASAVGALEAAGVECSRDGAGECVAIVRAPESGEWLWAWSPLAWQYVPSPTQEARHADAVARAVHKLDEALRVAGLLPWTNDAQLGAPGASQSSPSQALQWALDIGAAPGAWTGLLAPVCSAAGGGVIAVDPAELSPAVAAMPGVHHVRKLAQEASQDIERITGGRKVDLLASDANAHPAEFAPVLRELVSRHLRPGGVVVLTLKFRGLGRERADAAANLDAAFTGVVQSPSTLVWLIAGTEHERTYIARTPLA
eukprot:m51a1_g110 hypothetical protein (386) ;mRNA; f:330288-331445